VKTKLNTQQLQRNVRLQVILRVFQKRVFLPLTPIYFTAVGGLSLQDLGILAMWFAAVQVIVEIPTGMLADRFGKVRAERVGAFLNICSTLLYVFMPNHLGIFVGVGLEAIGYSFFGGSCEALLHDTLQAQGRIKRYTQTLSRIQSMSLAINAVLVTVVPLTYKFDPRYPFLIGTLAYTTLFVTTFFLREVYPYAPSQHASKRHWMPRWSVIRRYKKYGLFLMSFGIISALYTAPTDFVTIALRDLGMRPESLGFLFGVASLVGVAAGWFMHLFKKFPFYVYGLVDWVFIFIWFAAVWFSNLRVLLVVYIINMAFWRYRRIIYQEKILQILQTNQKATALSVMNNATQINELYVPIVFGFAAAAYGIPATFGMASLFLIGFLFVWIAALRTIPGDTLEPQHVIPDAPVTARND